MEEEPSKPPAPLALDYASPPPPEPPAPHAVPGRYGGLAVLLVSVNAFGGIVMAVAGLLQLGDRPEFGWWMIAAGLAAAVATLRYLGRDAPRWWRAWVASTVCVACLAALWRSADAADAALTDVERREYEDVKYVRRWAARTEVPRVDFARDAAVVGLPPAIALWAWVAWRAVRRRAVTPPCGPG